MGPFLDPWNVVGMRTTASSWNIPRKYGPHGKALLLPHKERAGARWERCPPARRLMKSMRSTMSRTSLRRAGLSLSRGLGACAGKIELPFGIGPLMAVILLPLLLTVAVF